MRGEGRAERSRTKPHGELGSRIKRAREAAGLSQNDLAKSLGVTPGAVSQWETGYSGPKRGLLDSLAKALNLPLTELLTSPRAGMLPVRQASAGRASVALNAALLDEAMEAGIDVEAVLNAHLRDMVNSARRYRWLRENRDALADANAFLERHGLWSDGRRQF